MNGNENGNGVVDTGAMPYGFNRRRITIRRISIGGWGVYRDDTYTGYHSLDRGEAEEIGRGYAMSNGDTWIGAQEG